MKFQIFGLLAVICIGSSTALECYNCVYVQDVDISHSNCEKKPSNDYLFRCAGTRSLPTSTNLTTNVQVKSGDEIIFGVDILQGKQSSINMCGKFTGLLSTKNVVARACGNGDPSLDGRCTQEGVTLEVAGIRATDVTACFCSGNKCNGAQSIQLASFLSVFTLAIVFISTKL